MKKHLIPAILLITGTSLLLSACMSPTDPDTPRRRIAEPDRYFLRTLDFSEYDVGYDVAPLEDGGYIITGRTWMQHTGSKDVLLLRTDAEGRQLWIKTYGGVYTDEGFSVAPTSDGGFIITGLTESYTNGFSDIFLVKADAQGNMQWSTSFGGTGYDIGQEVLECANGDFILVGYSQVSIGGNWYATIYRTDQLGNKIWSKDFGSSERNFGASIREVEDGGFIVTGSTDATTQGSSALWLFKIAANGDMEWERQLTRAGGMNGNQVVKAPDGTFAIAGESYEPSSPEKQSAGRNSSMVFVRTDALGDRVSETVLMENAAGADLAVTPDGGFILCGYSDPFYLDGSDIVLARLDASGNLLWKKSLGGLRMDRAYAVDNTSDGGFIITGTTRSYGRGNEDVILIKTDASGQYGE